MAGATRSLEVDAGVAASVLESRAKKPVALEEQMALPITSEGMVRHPMHPPSPQVVPLAAEQDKVEEIEHEEARPQSVRILHKHGDEVVVVEEEDTTREVRRLKSALSTVMKQIKRMEPLTEGNTNLKEVVKLMEKNIKRAQRERDLAESNARDLEYQKGALSKQLAAVSEQLPSSSKQLERISEQLRSLSKQKKGARFARGTGAMKLQELEDEVEDATKRLARDVDLFGEVDREGQT
ncbi:uncharacterized protein [Miscanthus floridulus]|uniref:uncharacterized protein n=1 Tax=Miscanthus floridulus TaxID=154761 RepID=UPI00345A7D6D